MMATNQLMGIILHTALFFLAAFVPVDGLSRSGQDEDVDIQLLDHIVGFLEQVIMDDLSLQRGEARVARGGGDGRRAGEGSCWGGRGQHGGGFCIQNLCIEQ